jgi:prepilin-type N-terminal cleavage/methylation domain-containing protein
MLVKTHDGYSLIELMIVVVIIGLLAAMAIPKFIDATRKAKEAEAHMLLKGAHNILHSYIIYHDACPNFATWASDIGFGSASGKYYNLALISCSVTPTGPDFSIQATPIVAGPRNYQIDEQGHQSEF